MNTQIIAYSKSEYKNENHSHSCPHCGSTSFKTGAGLKPGQQSQRCSDCGEFLGYSPIKQLKRLRKRKDFTESLELLESHGIRSEEAEIFVLSEIGAMEGEL